MNKIKISSYLIGVAICTFLAIFVFIVENSYEKLMGPIKESQNSSLSRPINPNLDLDSLDRIEKRREYTEDIFLTPPTPTDIVILDTPDETRD